MKAAYPICARILFALFFLFVSLYCLLCYVPFTYLQVIKQVLFPPLKTFSVIEHWLYWGVLAVVAPVLGVRRTRSLRLFWLVHVVAGVLLVFRPLLPRIENNSASLAWAMVHMLPVLWIAQLGWQRHFPRVRWAQTCEWNERRVFAAAWQASVFLSVLFAILGWTRRAGAGGNMAAEGFGLGVSLLSHVLVLLVFFVVLNFMGVVASWTERPVLFQFALCHLLGTALMWLAIRSIVFSAMSFSGPAASMYAIAYSLTAAAFLSSICLSRATMAGRIVTNGLALSFWIVKDRSRSPLRIAFGALAVSLAAWVMLGRAALMDWNYLVQKLIVTTIWIAVFRLFYIAYWAARRAPARTGRLLACALIMLPSYRTYEASRQFIWKGIDTKITVAQFLDRWAGYDVSFKLIHDALAPDVADEGFYHFLIQNTNISRSTQVDPVPVNLVDTLTATAAKKPNIFIITIDSLRRDYLSPYNNKVDFTPEIDRFAKESVVMENAFTHYGGTGLSEPSIWVGGMLLHKQYVTPFQSMNALEKLIRAENYRAYVSRDTILQTVVTAWPNLVELDQSVAPMDYDLCNSLEELDGKIMSDPGGAPLFAYTQPQNIHISVITRQGAKPISNEDYHSFYAPYASRIKRMDVCFGKFIGTLKSKGIYDSSIVILTADHGDSLGEQGRWGHAYTIYPEIVRIPLLMHLPPAVRETMHTNPKELAFSTDITPTLYYLTGHQPTNHNELFGKPLVLSDASEATKWRHNNYLIASSYAAVYGILNRDGSKLSVADAVSYRDYEFNLGLFGSDNSSLSGSEKTSNEELIRKKVLELNKFYGFANSNNAH